MLLIFPIVWLIDTMFLRTSIQMEYVIYISLSVFSGYLIYIDRISVVSAIGIIFALLIIQLVIVRFIHHTMNGQMNFFR